MIISLWKHISKCVYKGISKKIQLRRKTHTGYEQGWDLRLNKKKKAEHQHWAPSTCQVDTRGSHLNFCSHASHTGTYCSFEPGAGRATNSKLQNSGAQKLEVLIPSQSEAGHRQ